MPVGVAQIPVAHALVTAEWWGRRNPWAGRVLDQVAPQVGQVTQFTVRDGDERHVADEAAGGS